MSRLNSGLFTSNRDDWETPDSLFQALNSEFGFTLDVCANPTNHKSDNYFDPSNDGLSQSWQWNICWMNPPYGREIGKWVAKARKEADEGGSIVVCLLPARTDTAWFHDYIYGRAEIRFLRGRVRFVGAPYGAPFPSMICIFHPKFDVEDVSSTVKQKVMDSGK